MRRAHARIVIEPIFDRCVRRIGGDRVDAILSPKRGSERADYYFEADNVVAELKCIEKNPLADRRFKERLSALYSSWVNAGKKVPIIYGKGTLRTADLPRECALQFLGLLKRQLENSYIRKANRQIRETKKALGCNDATGLLLLANDGYPELTPAAAGHLLHRSLHGQYSSIDQVIYFSVNMSVDIPELSTDGCLVWIPFTHATRTSCADDFVRRLRTAWISEVEIERKRSIPTFTADTVPATALDSMRFRRVASED